MDANNMRHKGFIVTYLTILSAIFLIVVAVSFVGKRIPTGDLEILDPDGGRYEEAGIAKDYDSYRVDDLDAQAEQDRLAALYREREVYVRPVMPASAPDRAADVRASAPLSAPAKAPSSAPTALVPAASPARGTTTDSAKRLPVPAENAFVSKINSRISFSYPSGAKVTERKPAGAASDSAISFTVSMADGNDISISYDKAAGGCFDPIRSFAISPGSRIDYRNLSASRSLIIEEKYQAQRTDEEIGSYAFAGSDPARPFIYAANVCAHTPVPSRIRLVSTEYRAGDKDLVLAAFDMILSKMAL